VFYVYGEAQRPGSFRIERGMTVMQALAQAGGPTPRGSQERLQLHRQQGDGGVRTLVPKMSDLIQSNDVIFVRDSLF
jgi:polysaccharide export outer membrane protein